MRSLLRRVLVLSLLLTFVFSSCEETSFDVTEIEVAPYEPPTEITNTLIRALSAENQTGLELGCLSVQFPFQLLLSDGNSVTINSELAFEELSENATTLTIVDFVFPVTVLHPAGYNQNLANWEEFTQALTTCVPDSGWTTLQVPAYVINFDNSCYALVYPVSLVDVNGDHFSASSASNLVNLTAAEQLFFSFPLTLLDENGTAILIQDAQTLHASLQSCFHQSTISIEYVSPDGSSINCFDLIFPFSINLNTGNTVEIQNGEHFTSYLYGGWFDDFVYPMQLYLNEADSILVVENGQEFNALSTSRCEEIQIYVDFIVLLTAPPSCFEAVFPIDAIRPNGSIVSIPDLATLAILIQENEAIFYRIAFPIQLVLTESGQTVSVESLEEILDYLEACD